MFAFRRPVLLALLLLSLAGPMAWADDDVEADAPDPFKPKAESPAIKKSVRKARPVPKKTAPKKAPAAGPAPVPALERGIDLMQQERYEAARPWLLKAVQQDRRSAAAWYWYGMYHERTGKFYQAQYFYSKAVECDPAFDPLSRVVVYPSDGGKTPLWDPRRPARVFPVPTDTQGVVTIPPDAPQARQLPSRPSGDPELPRVPVYTPPEPGAEPNAGDAWHPAVYVPPTMGQASDADGEEGLPGYVPPRSAQSPTPSNAAPVAMTPPPSGPVYQPPATPAPHAQAAYVPPDIPANTKPAAPAKRAAAKKPAPRKVVRKKAAAPSAKPAAASKAEPKTTPEEPVKAAAKEPEPKVAVHDLPPVGQTADNVAPAMPPVGQSK